MPKKTKKEKILAEYRKKLRLLKEKSISDQKLESIIKKEKRITPQSKKSTQTKEITKEEYLISSHFINDLKKSLLISFSLIFLQFFIYFSKLIK